MSGLINLGAPAMRADAQGRAVPVPGGGPEAVLYEGPLSVGGTATTKELGLGFRAFPFAHLVPGRMCVRIYAASAFSATVRPYRGSGAASIRSPTTTTSSSPAAASSSTAPCPLGIGGDLAGDRTQVEMSLAADPVPLVDWRRMARVYH